MRLPQNRGRPDFLKLPPEESLDERLRRKPADADKIFDEGEFVDFIKPLVNTLDLYHNQAADPRIAAYSLQETQENHPEAKMKMRSVEVRGEHHDKVLIRVETIPEADHSVLHKEYFDTYNRLKPLSPEQLRAVLAEKEKEIERYNSLLSAEVNRPSVIIENKNNQGVTMSENSGEQINTDKFIGVGFNKDGGKIEGSNFAETIHESQEPNLPQAAKDIQ